MAAIDFIEEDQEESPSTDEFDFIPEEPIQEPQLPVIPPKATGLTSGIIQPPATAEPLSIMSVGGPSLPELGQMAMGAIGRTVSGLARTARDLMTPTTWLPPEQRPPPPFVLPMGPEEGASIRPRTAEEMAAAEPIQAGKPLYEPEPGSPTAEQNELARLLSRWSTPESLATLPAGTTKAGAALLFSTVVPGLVDQIKDTVSGKGTEEEKRDRINDMVALAALFVSGKAKGAEPLKAEEPSVVPVTEKAPASPHDFEPALDVQGKLVTGGENHDQIKNNALAQAKTPEERVAILEAFIDDSKHVFRDKNGEVYSRSELSQELGEKEPMRSERLKELKQSTPMPEPTPPLLPPIPETPERVPSIGAGIQAALMRKGEAGAVTVPKPLEDAVVKARDTIKVLAKTKGVRDTLAYTKDVAGNLATVYGQRIGNDIRGELRRSMGREESIPLDEEALTFVREANGDRSQLAVMRSKIDGSPVASPKWKKRSIKAIDHAESNWDRLNPIASQYEAATHNQITAENNAGINTIERPGYVMHAQDVVNDFGFFSDVAGEGTTGFKHIRTYPTFADSIAAGVDPKSINSVTLLKQRIARGQQLINNRAWVEGLRTTVDPVTRKPLVTNPETIARGPGLPPDVRPPQDYVTEIAGGRPIAVLKPYAGIFRALTEPSRFSQSLGWNAALKGATTGKHIALMLDTFHLGRIAFWESIIKPLSLTDPKLPVPSYKRGVLSLDYSPQELQRMAAAGEISAQQLPAILDAHRSVNNLLKHGYNLAKISDLLHQEWLQQIPVTGTFNKWLFNQFQRGAMAEVGSLEVGRYRRMNPSKSDEWVYRQVAKDLNTRFGNLGRQGIFKSRTAQDTARLIFLAPQWNEGLMRSEVGAITGTFKGIASSAKERRLSFGVLPRAIGVMAVGQFAANQIINYATRGHPTWQNPEEGLGAKLSAWVPDFIGGGPGFFLHPLGLAAEVTHLLTQKYEKRGDLREAIMGFMGGRWSTLARPAVTFLSRRDVFGRLIRPEDIWKETAKAGVPLPIGASAAIPAMKERIMGESREAFPGQYQKQMMASVGVKTEQTPSASQRMVALAQEFKKKLGIKESGEFYASAYAPLRNALRRGALQEARQAYEELLKQDRKPEQIDKAVKPWTGGVVNKETLEVSPRKMKPLTGSAKHEREFLKTLNPEQREAYRQAREEWVQFYRNFRTMLRQTAP